MQRRAYDRNQINRILHRLDYHGKHRPLGYGIVWGYNRNYYMEESMKKVKDLLQYETKCIDGRDQSRLFCFFTEEELNSIGITMKEEYVGTHETIPLTRDAVLEKLKRDVAFGFEKALDKRGISASCMFSVVMMWNWVLEEGLENFSENNYAQYGLPLFKATALKYGFDNPIGDDVGNEYKYSDD